MHFVDEEDVADQPLWMQGTSSWDPKCHGTENTGDGILPKIGSVNADGSSHTITNDSVHSVDVALQNPNFHDHEMLSWLHFPVDDIIEKGFYADLFKEVPGSTVQIVKHSFDQLGLQQEPASLPLNATTESLLNDLLPSNQGFSGISFYSSGVQGVEAVESRSSCPIDVKNTVAGADAARIVQRGAIASTNACQRMGPETLSRILIPASVDGTCPVVAPVSKHKNLDTDPLSAFSPLHRPSLPTSLSLPQDALPLPVLKPLDASLCTTQPITHRNFSHFSSPVAETRASLHAVSATSGLSSIERARQHHGPAGKVVNSQKKQVCQAESILIDGRRQASLPTSNIPPAFGCMQTAEASKGNSVSELNLVSSHFCDSAITASNRAVEKLYVAEQTATSLSRGSGSSSDEKSGRDATTVFKQRGSGVDDSECQSEDLEEATNSSKRSMKRSRAAEMHNLCERKRRDRINGKLMALRDLMPNSSKTAKASILDEAIKYVKLLQSQLQAWSARTGICIPPALIPSIGLQPLQMPDVPHMGLGMGMGMGVGLGMGLGMGMGMGMGLVDAKTAAAVAAGRTMLSLPSYTAQASSLPSHSMSSLQPCVPVMAVVDGQEPVPTSQFLDPSNMHLPPHQAQIYPSPMNMPMYTSMELYNAYVQGQQQQQLQWQQHQWQLMQQQQLQGNNCSKRTQ